MRMQLRALRDAGEGAEIGCERGALKFWLRSGARARRIPVRAVRDAARERFVVDHGLCVPNAAVVFVHNLATEASAHVPRQDWRGAGRRGTELLRRAASGRAARRELAPRRGRACARGSALAPERVVVQHPGFRAARFNPSRAAELRASARRELGVAPDAPLVGLITSGDFEKRGLDVFVGGGRADRGRATRRALPRRRLEVAARRRFAATPSSGPADCCIGRRAAPPSAGSRRWISFYIPRSSRSSGWWSWRRRRWGCRS